MGTGTVERWRGRFRARLPTCDREILGVCDTPDDAASLLDGWLAERIDGCTLPTSGLTLRDFGAAWLDRRELDGYRNIATDRSRWRTHVEASQFAGWALKSITRAAVIEWTDSLKRKRATPGNQQRKRHIQRRRLARSTIQNVLNLLRCCLADALHRGHIRENPADGVRLRMKVERTEEPWTYLTHDEQRAVFACEDIPSADRLILQFAIGTGLREGEIWNLELRDLHTDGPKPYVFVRFGSKGKPPKNGKARRVPLFGYGLDAAARWLGQLDAYVDGYDNEHRLVFPTARGCRRQEGKPPGGRNIVDGRTRYRFHDWMTAVGIGRDVRFHDLRHTAGSALVSGMWGRTWGLIKVRDFLGHQSVKTTERYAHLAPSALEEAATEMPPASHLSAPVRSKTSAPPARIGLATFGLGRRAFPEAGAGVASDLWHNADAVATALRESLAALGAGEPFALRRLIDAAEEASALLGAMSETSRQCVVAT
jgi:integrase